MTEQERDEAIQHIGFEYKTNQINSAQFLKEIIQIFEHYNSNQTKN